MATLDRDGVISFGGEYLKLAVGLFEQSCKEFAQHSLNQMAESEARWRVLSLRESCGERIPLRVRLTNGTP